MPRPFLDYTKGMDKQAFQSSYQRLNQAQKLAVDTIDGPVLVIAGPGTGKTQLLSLRIANILANTDTLPENILCLTFTESAAQNMRTRLASIVGPAAYQITISTYHGFGSELLRRFPAYFAASSDAQPADDLTIDAIYREITGRLPYSNPLKFETFLRDVKQLISDSKRALITPANLATIVAANEGFITACSTLTRELLQPLTRIDKKTYELFQQLYTATDSLAGKTSDSSFVSLATLWQESLASALAEADISGKTQPLTKWKNDWLAKDENGQWICDGADQNKRIAAAVTIYEQYLQELETRNLFDYDDMILRAITGLEEHADLRFTLQEQYQYLLLDEFQDTNEAQAKMVTLLTDNTVNEGRPNVLAVGDDDQAIYAFQGANYSHMLDFYKHYRDTLVVTLTENYRSTQDILDTATGIADQIATRLHYAFPAVNKDLTAAKPTHEGQDVSRHEFKSVISQNAWIASQISNLIKNGTPAREIAVLAPKHTFLEELVPYLKQQEIAVHYEKREDVLQDPLVAQLIMMSRLVLALNKHDQETANSLWPQVLSFPFWYLPTSLLWELSWQSHDEREVWTDTLCQRPETKSLALYFIRLSQLCDAQSMEQILDLLIGVSPVDLQELSEPLFTSPLYKFYFHADGSETDDTEAFWQLLSNLTVLRERLRDYRAAELAPLKLQDFIAFVEAHEQAGIKIINTNPYQESTDAVELMTAYKAKGQEYDAVFVMAAIDEVWGTKARAMGSRLSLPPNLQYIRYAGTTEDERLRLLYVAMTRAKTKLFITNYTTSYSGRTTTRLKYLQEFNPIDKPDELQSPLLPNGSQLVIQNDLTAPELADITAHWQHRHFKAVQQPTLKQLLASRLSRYQLSPTELNCFIDTRTDGPQTFFAQSLLCFPSAPSVSSQFGSTMHEILEWIQRQTNQQGSIPTYEAAAAVFDQKLRAKRLSELDTKLLGQRGREALRMYLKQRKHTIVPGSDVERNFRSEGIMIGDARLSGKIDKIIVDKQSKTAVIVDYKTGRAHTKWEKEPKLLFYRNQLYFYKLLVENSSTYRGYTVTDAYLEYVEPDQQGRIQELHVTFDDAEMERLKQLIQKVWQHIQSLDFPETAAYGDSYQAIETFISDLLDDKI